MPIRALCREVPAIACRACEANSQDRHNSPTARERDSAGDRPALVAEAGLPPVRAQCSSSFSTLTSRSWRASATAERAAPALAGLAMAGVCRVVTAPGPARPAGSPAVVTEQMRALDHLAPAGGEEEGTVPRQRRHCFRTSACFRRTPVPRSWRCFETFCCVKPSVSASSCGVASPARSCSTSRSRATCLRTRSRSVTRTNLPSVISTRSFTMDGVRVSARVPLCLYERTPRRLYVHARRRRGRHAHRERAAAGWPFDDDPLPLIPSAMPRWAASVTLGRPASGRRMRRSGWPRRCRPSRPRRG